MTRTKVCTQCGVDKDVDQYYVQRQKSRSDRLQSECKECKKNRVNVRGERADVKAANLSAYRLRVYGINTEEYDAMAEEQGGTCAICNKEEKLVVDHCHDTGRVRGLLCSNCNAGIGLLGDKAEGVRNAVNYLLLTEEEGSGTT